MTTPSDEPVAFTADRAALEAEAAGNTALPGETPPAAQPAAAPAKTSAQVEAEILSAPRKTSADLSREQIIAKAQANRGNIDDSEASMQTGVRAMLTEAMLAEAGGGVSIAPTAPTGAVDDGVPRAPAPRVESRPLDRPQDMVTLTVEGRQVQVPRSRIEEAGVRALQLETNADYILQRANLVAQANLTRSAELDARLAEIEALRAATPTGASAPAERADLPSGGTTISEGTRKALNALLDGDVNLAGENLQRVVAETAEAVVQRRMAATPAPAAASAPSTDGSLKVWPLEQRQKVSAKMLAVFPEFYNDRALADRYLARMTTEMADPVNLAGRVDLELLALSVGREVTSNARPAPPPVPSANGVHDELAARRALAARIPAMPISAAPRNPGPAPEAPPPSKSQIVAGMRKARGQA